MTVVVPLVGELSLIVLVLWVIALSLGIAIVLGYVAGKLHGLPFPLNQLAGPVNSLSKGITNVCFAAVHKGEQLLGAELHMLARYWDKLWSEIRRHAIVGLETALYIPLLVSAYHKLKALVHRLEHAGAGVGGAVKRLEKEYHGIDARVRDLERKIAHGIGHDLRIHIKALEKWEKGAQAAITQTIPNAIAGVAGDIADLKRFLGIKKLTTYAEWAGAVALTAIGVDALSSIRCDEFGRNFRNRGCSQWGALDSLLGLLALGIIAAEFDALVHEAQDLTEGAVSVFDTIFDLSR